MIEKQHTSKLSCVAPQGAYTRLANRFLKDYRETFETQNPPDEILEAFEQIKDGKLFDDMEQSQERTFPWDGGISRYVKEELQCYALWENGGSEYVLYYYFLRIERYEKHYSGVKLSADSYSTLQQEIYRHKSPVRYFCTQRPPSPGAIPGNYVTYDAYPNSRYQGQWCPGEATYSDYLPDEDLRRYGLELDPDWTRERNARAFGIYE